MSGSMLWLRKNRRERIEMSKRKPIRAGSVDLEWEEDGGFYTSEDGRIVVAMACEYVRDWDAYVDMVSCCASCDPVATAKTPKAAVNKLRRELKRTRERLLRDVEIIDRLLEVPGT